MPDSVYGLSDDGQVIGRAAGDEVIIINFRTGVYYSFGGAGVLLWALLQAGSSDAAMRERLAHAYGLRSDAIAADVAEAIGSLLEEGLIQVVDRQSASDVALPDAVGAYAKPILERHDDLADSFAVDPPLDIGR